MARARFIRPEFFTDTKLSDMPMGASLLFAGMWCHSDLNGVFEWDGRLLRGLIFPMRNDVSVEDVWSWMAMLACAGMVRAGCQQCADCNNGKTKQWGVIVNWSKYQSISGSEAKWGSKRPNPNDINTASGMPILSTAPCHAQAASPSPSPSPSQTLTNGESSATPPKKDHEGAMRVFDAFWTDYDKKVGKADCVKFWLRMSDEDQDAALEGAKVYASAHPDPQYRKDPIRYLRGKLWQDEAAPNGKVCPHPPGTDAWLNWHANNSDSVLER